MGTNYVMIKWKRCNNGEVVNATGPAVLHLQGNDYTVGLKQEDFHS